MLTESFHERCDRHHGQQEKRRLFCLARPENAFALPFIRPSRNRIFANVEMTLSDRFPCDSGDLRRHIQIYDKETADELSDGTRRRGGIPPLIEQPQPPIKNGSLPEDKLPLRLCWGNLPLAIPVAACLASGFRSSALMVSDYPRICLRLSASVADPQLVQSPDDPRQTDPFRLAPSLFGLSPIIDREIIFLFLRKTNCSSRPSSGFRAVLRVIAD